VAKDASPNTQKLALNALMFLYNRFLNSPIEQLNFKYAKKQTRTPTVFTHDEAISIINCMVMPYKLLAQLMYGGGLRVSEALRLRVKDVDFAMGYIVIRDGCASINMLAVTHFAIPSLPDFCKPSMI
jgi:integrase